MAGISNFYRGDTLKYNIILKDKDGIPVDLTGSTFWLTMKSDPTMDDTSAEIQKSVSTHIDAVNGKTAIVIPSTETDVLEPASTLYYDIQWVTSSGEVTTIISGKVKVLRDITRSY